MKCACLLWPVQNAHVLPVLEVDDLWLPSTQHANTPWPWKRLTIAEFQLSLLVKLPWPGGEGAPRKVVWDKIRIDKHVEQVGVDLGSHSILTDTHKHTTHTHTHTHTTHAGGAVSKSRGLRTGYAHTDTEAHTHIHTHS